MNSPIRRFTVLNSPSQTNLLSPLVSGESSCRVERPHEPAHRLAPTALSVTAASDIEYGDQNEDRTEKTEHECDDIERGHAAKQRPEEHANERDL